MKSIGMILIAALVLVAAEMTLVQPAEIAASMAKTKPAVFYVGPNVLYRSKHIPGAVFAGPGSGPAGIALLKAGVQKLPKDREIVIYCGCCPWDRCPNM